MHQALLYDFWQSSARGRRSCRPGVGAQHGAYPAAGGVQALGAAGSAPRYAAGRGAPAAPLAGGGRSALGALTVPEETTSITPLTSIAATPAAASSTVGRPHGRLSS